MFSGLSGHILEIVIVLVIVLIIWGPGKLPSLGGAIGRGIREFRQAKDPQDPEGKGPTPVAHAAGPQVGATSGTGATSGEPRSQV